MWPFIPCSEQIWDFLLKLWELLPVPSETCIESGKFSNDGDPCEKMSAPSDSCPPWPLYQPSTQSKEDPGLQIMSSLALTSPRIAAVSNPSQQSR